MSSPVNVIMVALDRVQRMVVDAFARQRSVPAREVEAFVPVLVGRLVAHEIGHYLLEDGQHAAYGLMRGKCGPDDVKCAPRCSLAEAQRRRLRMLWAQRTNAEPRVAMR